MLAISVPVYYALYRSLHMMMGSFPDGILLTISGMRLTTNAWAGHRQTQ
jgi:hypothetical protein